MTIEEMKRLKEELGYSNETIAKLSGVPFATVQKVFGGVTARPRQKTVEALRKVFEQQEPEKTGREETATSAAGTFSSVLRESMPVYQAQKRGKTIEDIYALPGGVHAELINGRIYYMSSPSRIHQEIADGLYFAIVSHIRQHGGSCRAYTSNFAVYLNGDDSIYVEPDLTVVCDLSKLDERGCCGAPDWVIEVLSPSTQQMDLNRKMILYRDAGVREYWIIDPKRQIVIVYQFAAPDEPAAIFGFEEEIAGLVLPGFAVRLSDLPDI